MATLVTDKPMTATKPITNPELSVKVGESFEIKLAENPTTGYTWALARLPENFYLLSDSYVPDQPILAGSGGTHHFNFVAMKPHMGNFVFYLLRPWEPFTPTQESDWRVKAN